MSASPSPAPSSGPVNRHAPTATEKQRMQLDKLFKDPSKPAYVPPPPKEKTIRPPREMMKNVQGSSAGAGSGEFHVYKASRRREYERLKLMEEKVEKETVAKEYEEKRRKQEEEAEAKTAKNRAKRLKKKERSKVKASGSGGPKGEQDDSTGPTSNPPSEMPLKKRRLVNGSELVFRKPGEEDEEVEGETGVQPQTQEQLPLDEPPAGLVPTSASGSTMIIHDDD